MCFLSERDRQRDRERERETDRQRERKLAELMHAGITCIVVVVFFSLGLPMTFCRPPPTLSLEKKIRLTETILSV